MCGKAEQTWREYLLENLPDLYVEMCTDENRNLAWRDEKIRRLEKKIGPLEEKSEIHYLASVGSVVERKKVQKSCSNKQKEIMILRGLLRGLVPNTSDRNAPADNEALHNTVVYLDSVERGAPGYKAGISNLNKLIEKEELRISKKEAG